MGLLWALVRSLAKVCQQQFLTNCTMLAEYFAGLFLFYFISELTSATVHKE